MAELSEFNNRIIQIGNQVVFGWLPTQAAFKKVVEDEEIANLSDEALQGLIEEADRYWRGQIAGSRPENNIIYPVLMGDCAQARLQALSHLGKALSGAEKAAHDERRARWITITAQCLLAQGLAFLLIPAPQQAWEAFMNASVGARALPDSGELRLREALWAAYGMFVSAQLGRQEQLIKIAANDVAALVRITGREQEAQEYIKEIEQQLELIRTHMRQQTAPEQEPSAPEPTSVSEQGQPEAAADDSTTYNLHYIDLLNHYAEQVEAGTLSLEEVKALLRQEVDFTHLISRHVYFTSLLQRQLAEQDSARAVLRADLNYSMAQHLHDDLAELTRGYCAFALGLALVGQGRARRDDPDSFRRAIPFLEEALPILEQKESTTGDIENGLIGLALSYREAGNFEKARDLCLRAIQRLEQQPEWRVNLGVAYGNLADVQEQLGKPIEAFANHYQAFEIFLAEKNLHRARQALGYISTLSTRTGHVDDAIAAWERLATLMTEVADFKGAAEAYLALTYHLFRIRRFKESISYLAQAKNVLEPLVSVQHSDKQVLKLYHHVLLRVGALYSLLLDAPDQGSGFKQAYEPLEQSRQVAVSLQDADLLAASLVQLAILCEESGRLDQAETYCQMIEHVPAGSLYRARGDEVLGVVRIRQQRYPEAIKLLHQAIATYDVQFKDQRATSWFRLGEAHEGMGDDKNAVQAYEASLDLFEQGRMELYEASRMGFVGNSTEVYERLITLYADSHGGAYDPKQALYWLEKSKSRTLAETLGLAQISLQNPPASIQDDLQEERFLLERVNTLRAQLFLSSPEAPETASRLQLQQELFQHLEKLKALWNRIANVVPEYVNLRQGLVVQWDELQVLFEPA